MNNKLINRFFAVTMICLIIFLPVRSYAILPLIPPAYYAAATVLPVLGGVAYTAYRSGAVAQFDSLGNVSRAISIATIHLLTDPVTGAKHLAVQELNANIHLAQGLLSNALASLDSAGNYLYNSYNGMFNSVPTFPLGSHAQIGNQTITITGVLYTGDDVGGTCNPSSVHASQLSNYFYTYYLAYSASRHCTVEFSNCYNFTVDSIPVTNVVTPSQTPTPPPPPLLNTASTGSTSGGAVTSGHAADVDAAIQSQAVAGATTITDDQNNPLVVPQGALTPAQAAAIDTAISNTQPAIDAALAQQAIAQTELDSALAESPSNPDRIYQARAAVAAANAAVANAVAAQNTAITQVAPNLPLVLPSGLHTVNFNAWLTLQGVLANKFPFNLLSFIPSFLQPLLSDPVPPSFDMHIYQDKSLHIDLAPFSPVVDVFRWVLSLLITIGFVFFMVKFWRGVS